MHMTEEELGQLLKKNPALRVRGMDQPKQDRKPVPKAKDTFDSEAERRCYELKILPGLLAGIITRCEMHKEFELLPAIKYRGLKFRRRVYTPDFFLEYRDSSIEVVEVKGRKIKKLQRDYPLRRHLFLHLYCIPNGWDFTEIHDDEI